MKSPGTWSSSRLTVGHATQNGRVGETVTTETKREDGRAGGRKADASQDGPRQHEQGPVGSVALAQSTRPPPHTGLPLAGWKVPGIPPKSPGASPRAVGPDSLGRRKPAVARQKLPDEGPTAPGESCSREGRGSGLHTGSEALDAGQSLPTFGIAALNFLKC